MKLRGRVAVIAALIVLVSAVLPNVSAGAVDWLTQRCTSGGMRAEVPDGYTVRLVGRVDCRERVPGASFAVAHFAPERAAGMVNTARLRPYAKTAPTRFDLGNTVSQAGQHAVCLVTSLRVRLSCAAFTALPEPATQLGALPISDLRGIGLRDPLIRWRPLEAGSGGGDGCGTCW